MPSVSEQIKQSIEKLHENSEALEKIVNGPATGPDSEVGLPIEGTQITVAKAIAESQARFESDGVLATVTQLKNDAETARDEANEARDSFDLLNLEKSKQATMEPLDMESIGTSAFENVDFDLSTVFPFYGWWKSRSGASTSSTSEVQANANGQVIQRFYDQAGTNHIDATSGNCSYWIDTNTISTGVPSVSFANDARKYISTVSGAISSTGVTVFGISDSDDETTSTGTLNQRLFTIATNTGISLLSLGQQGQFLKAIWKDSLDQTQELVTTYDVTADQAFSWAIVQDITNGTLRIYVDNALVGEQTGTTFSSTVHENFAWNGRHRTSAPVVSEGWDGQHAEVGVITIPLDSIEVNNIMAYLKTVSLLTYTTRSIEVLVHRADDAEIVAQDSNRQSYSVLLDIPAGKVSIGIATSNEGGILTVSHGSDSENVTITNDGLFNNSSSLFEHGITFDATGGEHTLSLALSAGTMRGIIVRSFDSVSRTIEDQGTGTHCFPLAIEHSNGRTYRIHAEMYSGDRYVSDGEGNSVKVFDGIPADENEHYHNSCSLIELSNGDILAFMVGHGRGYIYARLIEGANFSTLSSQRLFAASNDRNSYIHTVKISDGSIYCLVRDESVAGGAGLLHIETPEQLATSANTYEVILTSGFRMYPRKLEHLVHNGNDYLIPVWATREAAQWQGLACAVYNVTDDTWSTPEGAAAPNSFAPYFPSSSSTNTIETHPNTGQIVIKKTTGNGQFYVLNDVLVDYNSSGIRLATLFSESTRVSTAYNTSSVNWLCYSQGQSIRNGKIQGLAPNSYRVDCQFLEASQMAGVLVMSKRGTRPLHTDFSGQSAPFYFDWYGEDIQIFAYIWQNNEIFITEEREITTINKNGLTHGWLSHIPNTNKFDIQPAVNELHSTHRQTQRLTLEIEGL